MKKLSEFENNDVKIITVDERTIVAHVDVYCSSFDNHEDYAGLCLSNGEYISEEKIKSIDLYL